MHLRFLPVKLQLQPFINSFWWFESHNGLPEGDLRVIVPNGKAKIILPYQNAISTLSGNEATYYKEQEIFFIGVWDKPVVLSTSVRQTGTIGMELNPSAASRFTSVPMHALANRIYSFSELFGKKGSALEQQIGNCADPLQKAVLLQDFLIACMAAVQPGHTLIDYTVSKIMASNGLMEIRELEQKTGYSKRYLDILFKSHVGISPKTLSTILRFNTFYKLWAGSEQVDFFKNHLYDFYYDQSHFINEFKRYSGYAPRQYASLTNEFGRLFYKR